MKKFRRQIAERRGDYLHPPPRWRDRKFNRCGSWGMEIPQAQAVRRNAPPSQGRRGWKKYWKKRDAELHVSYQLPVHRDKPKIPRRVLADQQESKLWFEEIE